MTLETVRLNETGKPTACELINELLQEVGITDRIEPHNIEFTDNLLVNKSYLEYNPSTQENEMKLDRRITNIIFDHYYPIPVEKTFYHYTTLSGFRRIMSEEKLRLSYLSKNANYSEFNTFYKDHNLTGYDKTKSDSGKPMKEELMDETYSISFARKSGLTKENDEDLWVSFGDNGGGVRIEFEIDTNHIDFRNVHYIDEHFDKNTLLLNRLTDLVRKKFKRTFAIRAISKVGSFYLPGDYKTENETRFILKRNTDDYTMSKMGLEEDPKGKWVKIPFSSPLGKFKISKVMSGKGCDMKTFNEIINESKLDYPILTEHQSI